MNAYEIHVVGCRQCSRVEYGPRYRWSWQWLQYELTTRCREGVRLLAASVYEHAA